MSLARICDNMGQTAPYSFNFQQSGSSVTGSFMLGSINFPSTGGTVGSDGSLSLQATAIRDGVTVISTWALHNPGGTNPAITGSISQAWTSTTLSGQVNIAGTIGSSIRGATTSMISGATAKLSLGAVSEHGPVTAEILGLMAAGKR
jgi:hypothetical protein